MMLRNGTQTNFDSGFIRVVKNLLLEQQTELDEKKRIQKTSKLFSFLIGNNYWMKLPKFDKFKIVVLSKINELLNKSELERQEYQTLKQKLLKMKDMIQSEVRYYHDGDTPDIGYTISEYKDYYGSKWEYYWKHSFSYPVEMRYDEDGNAYSEEQFESIYGRHYRTLWDNATVKQE